MNRTEFLRRYNRSNLDEKKGNGLKMLQSMLKDLPEPQRRTLTKFISEYWAPLCDGLIEASKIVQDSTDASPKEACTYFLTPEQEETVGEIVQLFPTKPEYACTIRATVKAYRKDIDRAKLEGALINNFILDNAISLGLHPIHDPAYGRILYYRKKAEEVQQNGELQTAGAARA